MIKNMTYRNFMIVLHKIEKKGYAFPEAERMTRNIFEEFQACPEGLSIERRIDLIQEVAK